MNKTFTIALVLVIVVFGGYFLLKGKVQAPTNTETPDTTIPILDSSIPANQLNSQYVITYTNAGYSPNTLTIKLGDTVTWANDSSQNMWTASAMHPSHIVYSGTSLSEHCPDTVGISFDACKGIAPGNIWSFVFNKKGEWGFHNHLKSDHFGKIIVE